MKLEITYNVQKLKYLNLIMQENNHKNIFKNSLL